MISHPKLASLLTGVGAALWLSAGSAWGQGCIVGRQCSPGQIDGSNYLPPHQYDLSFNYRGFTADEHYNGTARQYQRQKLGNFVINRQNIFDATGTLGVTKQLSVLIDIPYIHSGWSIPLPVGSIGGASPGPRAQQNAQGLGDISLGLKYWVLNTDKHPNGNVALGIGVKLPTGKDNVTTDYPDITGGNIRQRTVDQSIQPGDGGWGIPTSLEAFKTFKSINVFATGNYLINPRDTNGVGSIIATLGVKPSPLAPSTNVNSVPDQYLIRIGVGAAIPRLTGVSASLAWRKEGVPAKDLIGGSHGFRRPGFSTSIEPSLSYTQLSTTYTLSLPQTLTRDRVPTESDGTQVSGDATFANSQVIVSITHRFGM